MLALPHPDTTARLLGRIALEAGRFLAAIADRSSGHVVKRDGTPSTAADLGSERLILARLAAAFPGVVVVAEESGTVGGAAAGLFFLVDPLDGTRDYLTGAGEYSVNIALVSGSRPLAAALAAPALGRVWIAGEGAFVAVMPDGPDAEPDWRPARVRSAPESGPVALTSRRHGDPETEHCLAQLPVGSRRTASSAAKFGLIASGEADLYIRCGPTMEWDTAAGDHILTRAGGAMIGPDGAPFAYGGVARGYRNGPFAAFGDAGIGRTVNLPKGLA